MDAGFVFRLFSEGDWSDATNKTVETNAGGNKRLLPVRRDRIAARRSVQMRRKAEQRIVRLRRQIGKRSAAGPATGARRCSGKLAGHARGLSADGVLDFPLEVQDR